MNIFGFIVKIIDHLLAIFINLLFFLFSTGELFDHGLDSLVCVFIPLILYSIVGRGQWGCSPIEGYWTAIFFFFGFYLSHWEKYITGTVYLPWVYDTGELVSGKIILIFWWDFILMYNIFKVKLPAI